MERWSCKVNNMFHDINLIHEIPQEVKDAALLLGNHFKKQCIDKWTLYDVSSRDNCLDDYKKGYNCALDTAISLARECKTSTTLIYGLEECKYKI